VVAKTNGKPMEKQWKTNGFKAFLILHVMNPITNLMNPIFGFAAGYLGMNAFSWIYIDLGYSYELGIIPFYDFCI
jgi:hypothetical protein